MADIILASPRTMIEQPIGQEVATRAAWVDAWEIVEGLHCLETVHAVAPTLPTASFLWVYGELTDPGDVAQAFGLQVPQDYGGLFVRVKWLFQGGIERFWYGVIEVGQDNQWGEDVLTAGGGFVASGEQHFTAYGLELLLARTAVTGSWFQERAEAPQFMERAIRFNADGVANRSIHVNNGVHHFQNAPIDADHWTSETVVEYLLKYFTMRSKGGAVVFDVTLDDPDQIVGTWDRPEIEAQDRSLYALLDEIIPRERLAGWRLEVNPLGEAVTVAPFSYAAQQILIPGGQAIPANANPIGRLDCSLDSSAAVQVKASDIKPVDQIIARGRRRRSVMSVSYMDITLGNGWTANEAGEYLDGGQRSPNYPPDSEVDAQREYNARIRGQDHLRDVFARFIINPGWNGKAGGGEGDTGQIVAAFPPIAQPNGDPFPKFDLDLVVLQTMPLYGGVDYEGDPTQIDFTNSTGVERPPLVVFKRPKDEAGSDPDFWHTAENAGLNASGPMYDSEREQREWSGVVSVPYSDRGIRVDLTGAPQHAIAKEDFKHFAHPAADEDLGDYSFRSGMIATLAIEGDNYCEGRFPAEAALPEKPDTVRKVIRAGESYKQDYIVPNTVVGVDASGALKRSTGGYLRDDSVALEQIAQIAYEWHAAARYSLSVATASPNGYGLVALGSLVQNVGRAGSEHDVPVNSVITQVRIASPVTEGSVAGQVYVSVQTGAGELDALRLGVAGPPRLAGVRAQAAPLRRPFPDRVAGPVSFLFGRTSEAEQ